MDSEENSGEENGRQPEKQRWATQAYGERLISCFLLCNELIEEDEVPL